MNDAMGTRSVCEDDRIGKERGTCVSSQLEVLSKGVDLLADAVGALEDRLGSVLLPQQQIPDERREPGGVREDPTLSQLAHVLVNFNEGLDRTRARLRSMVESVDL